MQWQEEVWLSYRSLFQESKSCWISGPLREGSLHYSLGLVWDVALLGSLFPRNGLLSTGSKRKYVYTGEGSWMLMAEDDRSRRWGDSGSVNTTAWLYGVSSSVPGAHNLSNKYDVTTVSGSEFDIASNRRYNLPVSGSEFDRELSTQGGRLYTVRYKGTHM